jgi:release factor glutamine methyltransferase
LFQSVFRKLASILFKPLLANYLKKDRVYYHSPFKLIILKGVFHPRFFYSTKFLLKYLQKVNFKSKNVIEVGAGSGLIAFHLALKANRVIALEINKIAVEGLILNQKNNSQILPPNVLQIIESNLFQSLDPQVFDYIVVNPPYYPKTPNNPTELAWYCGNEFEYFSSFFNQALNFINLQSIIVMVLSSQCNIERIHQIASQNGFIMKLKLEKKFLIENNFIFEIKLSETK